MTVHANLYYSEELEADIIKYMSRFNVSNKSEALRKLLSMGIAASGITFADNSSVQRGRPKIIKETPLNKLIKQIEFNEALEEPDIEVEAQTPTKRMFFD